MEAVYSVSPTYIRTICYKGNSAGEKGSHFYIAVEFYMLLAHGSKQWAYLRRSSTQSIASVVHGHNFFPPLLCAECPEIHNLITT